MKRPSDPSSALTPESKHAKLAPPSSPVLRIPITHTPEFKHKITKLRRRRYSWAVQAQQDLCGRFIRNVREQSVDFYDVLRKAVQVEACEGDIVALITHSVMKTSRPEKSGLLYPLEPPARKVSMESQNRAIENSWTAKFVNPSPLEGLKEHIAEQLELGLSSTTATSSGMGKSRLLDEFSKSYFMIPINLRHSEGQGTPISKAIPLPTTRPAVVLKEMGPTKFERIQNFRDFMSKDQSMGSAGKNRNKFYEEVIAKASEYESHGELGGAELSTALKALQNVLNSGDKKSFEHSIYIGNDPPGDESSRLADSFDDQNESRFVVLRRILSSISSEPLFSFFLSTTGKITQFGQPRGQDASNRINEGKLTTPRPYIYLGFDQLMQSQKVLVRWTTLDHVTSLECIAHMGRPLSSYFLDGVHAMTTAMRKSCVNLLDFAVQKLLCGKPGDKSLTEAQMYAVLSQRLALDINTPQYLFNSASPLDAMRTMHEQIANHMRVCVAVGGGIESLRGIAPSEPILSEAASDIMLSKEFDLPRALSLVLTGFSVDQGDRGELLVAAFFTWARDRAIKQQLPRPRERAPTVNPDLTAVYPYLYDSFDLDVKKVGFIIVQVKNDSNTSRSDDLKIFQNMDPFKCGILDLSDTEDGQFPIPIIRIVSLGKDGQPLFTSYDFMCSGIGLFGPVGDSLEVWRALVNKLNQWSSFYNVPVPNVLRSQLPGCGDGEGHFNSWLVVLYNIIRMLVTISYFGLRANFVDTTDPITGTGIEGVSNSIVVYKRICTGTKVYAPHTQLFILSVPAVIEPLGSIPGVASATSSGGAHAGYQMCQRPFRLQFWELATPSFGTPLVTTHDPPIQDWVQVISELTGAMGHMAKEFRPTAHAGSASCCTEDLDVDDLTEE
ncbi:hypothetical protein H4582DRAFT_2065292 [Lactarius indigo]|nr:hypothetical protein H4582DRAFT_2065292 [Lactarius indigo]